MTTFWGKESLYICHVESWVLYKYNMKRKKLSEQFLVKVFNWMFFLLFDVWELLSSLVLVPFIGLFLKVLEQQGSPK